MLGGIYMVAKARGQYEALGGHKARSSGRIDPKTGRTTCAVCDRLLTWHEDKHASRVRAIK